MIEIRLYILEKIVAILFDRRLRPEIAELANWQSLISKRRPVQQSKKSLRAAAKNQCTSIPTHKDFDVSQWKIRRQRMLFKTCLHTVCNPLKT